VYRSLCDWDESFKHRKSITYCMCLDFSLEIQHIQEGVKKSFYPNLQLSFGNTANFSLPTPSSSQSSGFVSYFIIWTRKVSDSNKI
jgi:hypothetical protein